MQRFSQIQRNRNAISILIIKSLLSFLFDSFHLFSAVRQIKNPYLGFPMIYLCFQFSIENATNTEMAQPFNEQNTVQLRITKTKTTRFNHENDKLSLVHTYDASISTSTSTRKSMCEPAGTMHNAYAVMSYVNRRACVEHCFLLSILHTNK